MSYIHRLSKSIFKVNSLRVKLHQLVPVIAANSRPISTSHCLFGQVLPFNLSDIGEGIREVHVKEWFVEVGDKVEQFDAICEVQSDKATVTISSRYDGVVVRRHYDVEDIALVGQPLVDIELNDGETDPSAKVQVDQIDPSLTDSLESKVIAMNSNKSLATPAVRKIAIENKISLSDIKGTGKEGRVLKEDILVHLENINNNTNAITAPDHKNIAQKKSAVTPKVDPKTSNIATSIKPIKPKSAVKTQDVTQSITGIRKVMVRKMTEANDIPHFGYCDEIEMDALVELRNSVKVAAAQHGVQFSYMPLFIKALSLALTEFPILNSCVDSKCENITYKSSHNIGFAMDTADGLMVPNIKNVQAMNMLQIAEELNRLMLLGNDGKLGTNDLGGATFTLSNIGSIGGTYAKPVILLPAVAIGAMGKIQTVAKFRPDGTVYPVKIMNMSWSADHRVIEGATMARFSNLWKSYLENPSTMLLHLQ